MTSHWDRWVLAAAAAALLLLIGRQSYLVFHAKATTADEIAEAQKVVQQADGNNPLPPLKDPKEHSERVLEAWETLPGEVKPLTQWNLYPNPGASPAPKPTFPRRGRGGS